MQDKKVKPICYLDIDGVVYYYPKNSPYGNHAEVRPHLFALLQTLHDCGFELRLLTCNDHGGKAMLKFVQESGCACLHDWKLEDVPSCYHSAQYNNGHRGSVYEKAAYIDLERPFVWLEDGIISEEIKFLEDRGWIDRYFEINAYVPDEFLRAIPWLKGKAKDFGMTVKEWVNESDPNSL